MKSKVIIVGAGGSGKDYLAKYLENKGFNKSISHTTRPPRKNEKEGEDYYFINEKSFENKINENYWNEYDNFIGWYYGTSNESYLNSNLFIKTPKGVSRLNDTQRKECLIIYLNIDENVRKERLSLRKGMADSVERRLMGDRKDFGNFKNYDMEINDPEFNCEYIYNNIIEKINI